MGESNRKGLLFETLSWLDSLPQPHINILPLGRTALLSSNFDRRSTNLGSYLSDDYEDVHPSWSDSLFATHSKLSFGFKRWRRSILRRKRTISYESQLISQIPMWRSFLYSTRAVSRWKLYATHRSRHRTAMQSRMKPLRLLSKRRRMLIFWKLWSNNLHRLKKRYYMCWKVFIQRLGKLRHIVLKLKTRNSIKIWKRRARWPRVASQWPTYHMKKSLKYWLAYSNLVYNRAVQAHDHSKGRKHLLHKILTAWQYNTNISKYFIRQKQMLMNRKRSELASLLAMWSEVVEGSLKQKEGLQRADVHFARVNSRKAFDTWYEMDYSKKLIQYAKRKHVQRQMKRMVRLWYKSVNKHSIYTEQSQVLYKDSLLHYVKKQFKIYRSRVLYSRRQHIMRLLYSRATRRLYLNSWQLHVTNTTMRQKCLSIQAVKHYKQRRLVQFVNTIRLIKYLRKKLRRRRKLACLQIHIRRYYKAIQSVLKQKYKMLRAMGRYEASSLVTVWRRWQRMKEKRKGLRRLYNIFKYHQAVKYRDSNNIMQLAVNASKQHGSISKLSHYPQYDQSLTGTSRTSVLLRILHSWRHGYLTKVKREKHLTHTIQLKHHFYLSMATYNHWHNALESYQVRRIVKEKAVQRWCRYLLIRKYQRKCVAKHSIIVTDRFRMHRLLKKWKRKVSDKHLCERRASFNKYKVIKHLQDRQAAIRTVELNRIVYSLKLFFFKWYGVQQHRHIRLKPILLKCSLISLWKLWICRYNQSVISTTLSLSTNKSHGKKRKIIDANPNPKQYNSSNMSKENSKPLGHIHSNHQTIRQVVGEFSYTTIHNDSKSLHDLSSNCNNTNRSVLRSVGKSDLLRGYVDHFQRKKKFGYVI